MKRMKRIRADKSICPTDLKIFSCNKMYGIVGNGFVGKATTLLFQEEDLIIYDIVPEKRIPKGISLSDLSQCDIIFVSVPTPMMETGKCDTSFVEEAVKDIRKECGDKILVIRSTVEPGTCSHLDCIHMPEFLCERSWKKDFEENDLWIFGLTPNQRGKEILIDIINNAYNNGRIKYNNISFVTNTESEIIKYIRNCFLAMKVSYFNEIYEICKQNNLNFNIIRDIVTRNLWINSYSSFVPGPDGKFGFGGHCLPKDLNALIYYAEETNCDPEILKAIRKRNIRDRKEILEIENN